MEQTCPNLLLLYSAGLFSVDALGERVSPPFLNVKTEKDTEENLDKNEILKIISDYIEGTERFTDKSNSKS